MKPAHFASTKGDGSNELMATDAVADVATHERQQAQFADDHGGASRESDGKAALSGVPVSGAAESVARCEWVYGNRCQWHIHYFECALPEGDKCEHRAASVVIKGSSGPTAAGGYAGGDGCLKDRKEIENE